MQSVIQNVTFITLTSCSIKLAMKELPLQFSNYINKFALLYWQILTVNNNYWGKRMLKGISKMLIFESHNGGACMAEK